MKVPIVNRVKGDTTWSTAFGRPKTIFIARIFAHRLKTVHAFHRPEPHQESGIRSKPLEILNYIVKAESLIFIAHGLSLVGPGFVLNGIRLFGVHPELMFAFLPTDELAFRKTGGVGEPKGKLKPEPDGVFGEEIHEIVHLVNGGLIHHFLVEEQKSDPPVTPMRLEKRHVGQYRGILAATYGDDDFIELVKDVAEPFLGCLGHVLRHIYLFEHKIPPGAESNQLDCDNKPRPPGDGW